MNLRHLRWGIDALTGLMVVSVGVALGGLTWRLAGYSGVAPTAAASADAAAAPVDIGGLLALAPFGTVAAASDAASDGSLHLKGILLAVPASASSALMAGADGKVASYGIGAALGGGVVEAIAADQVILRTPRGLQTVGFGPGGAGPAAAVSSVAAPGTAGKDAGFVPVGRAGRVPPTGWGAGAPSPGGLLIDDSAPAALLAAGLRQGDVVQQVDGVPVGPGTNGGAIARQLTGAALRGGAVGVVVLRDGNAVSLRLAIH